MPAQDIIALGSAVAALVAFGAAFYVRRWRNLAMIATAIYCAQLFVVPLMADRSEPRGANEVPILTAGRAMTENFLQGAGGLLGSITQGIGVGVGIVGQSLGADIAPNRNLVESIGRYVKAKSREMFPGDPGRRNDPMQKFALFAGGLAVFLLFASIFYGTRRAIGAGLTRSRSQQRLNAS